MLVRGWTIVLSVWIIAGCRTPAGPQVAAHPAVLRVSAGEPLHRVTAGDTLHRIARAHGTRVATLRSLNPGVEPRQLRVGQVLRLPALDVGRHGKPLLRAIRNVDDPAGEHDDGSVRLDEDPE